jgi:hypothetical protein
VASRETHGFREDILSALGTRHSALPGQPIPPLQDEWA